MWPAVCETFAVSVLFMAWTAGNCVQMGSSSSLRSGQNGYSVPCGVELEVKVEKYAHKSVCDTFEMKQKQYNQCEIQTSIASDRSNKAIQFITLEIEEI